MRRRAFIAGIAAVATLPPDVHAQQALHRVAMLLPPISETDKAAQARIAAFRSELQRLGWTDELKVRLEVHWGHGNSDRGKSLAEEVVRSMKPLSTGSETWVKTIGIVLVSLCSAANPESPETMIASRSRPTFRCRRRPSTNW